VGHDKKAAAPIWDEVEGVELYNIAGRPDVAAVVKDLSRLLRAAWRNAAPGFV
jgi:hypothetical protein